MLQLVEYIAHIVSSVKSFYDEDSVNAAGYKWGSAVRSSFDLKLVLSQIAEGA